LDDINLRHTSARNTIKRLFGILTHVYGENVSENEIQYTFII